MYGLRIYIDTDGAFSYIDTEFGNDDNERVFYFENRNDAVESLINSFHSLRNSLNTYGRENVDKWVKLFDDNIELICEKIPTFKIGKDFGNQEINYELFKCEKIKKDKYYYYNECFIDVDFSEYLTETIDWDYLNKCEGWV